MIKGFVMGSMQSIEAVSKAYFRCGSEELDIGVISGGLSDADKCLIKHKGKKYLLRLLPENQVLERRKQEIKVQQVAANAGLAPQVFHFDEKEYRYVLMGYVDARNVNDQDFLSERFVADLVKLTSKLHHLPVEQFQPVIPLLQRINNFIDDIESVQIRAFFNDADVQCYLQALQSKFMDLSVVLSHDDLHFGNMLTDGDRITLVDWTNAGVGHCYVDLALLAIFIAPAKHEFLLEQYFNRPPTDQEKKLLYDAMTMQYFMRAVGAVAQSPGEISLASLQCHSQERSVNYFMGLAAGDAELKTVADFERLARVSLNEFLERFEQWKLNDDARPRHKV